MPTTLVYPSSIATVPVANDDIDPELDDIDTGNHWAHLELMLEEALDDAREHANALVEATANLHGIIGQRLVMHFTHQLRGSVEVARYYRSQLQSLVLHEGDEAYLEEMDARVLSDTGIKLVVQARVSVPEIGVMPWDV